MYQLLNLRRTAALGIAAVGIEAVLSAATPNRHGQLLGQPAPSVLPSVAHLLALVVGLMLLVLVPQLWRGTRTAVSLAICGLGVLAILNVVKGLDYDEAVLDLCFAGLLVLGRRAFPRGCRNRPRLAAVCAAIGMWALTYCALLLGPLEQDRGHTIKQALHASLGHARVVQPWPWLIELMVVAAVALSLLAVRSLMRPAAGPNRHTDDDYRVARALVERHGRDSLSPFILRPDKAFHFAADGVLAYRVIGETAIVSADPVGGPAHSVLASFRELARRRGWQVVVWGAAATHIDTYRKLGMRTMCVGEEAFVYPARFTLEGRRVRKLRQSVHRLQRRGWDIRAYDGRDLDAGLDAEIDALEAGWRETQPRIVGFAMGMGPWDPVPRPDDLYVLARSPEGELSAVMRFAEHCGYLSLDTMRRLGETPNGLNEALICRALEIARERGVPEVSLNYAGLAHLVREEAATGLIYSRVRPLLQRLLGRRFQMARLVRFDEKFLPEWRPRFLVYESRLALPLAILRVLQAEGYVPETRALRPQTGLRPGSRPVPGTPQTHAAR